MHSQRVLFDNFPRVKINKKYKFQHIKIAKMPIFEVLPSSKLISRKILVVESFSNFHTVCVITYHIAVQSKCTISHLEGLKAILSAYSMPSMKVRNSGQTKADPA